MNKAEFKAIKKIAEKLGWKSVSLTTIMQMVKNQQSLELDCIGGCDDDEETLLSIALWDRDRIISTMCVSSYTDLISWGVECFCDDMHITREEFSNMLNWYACKDRLLAQWEEDILEEMYVDAYIALAETQASCRY